MNLKNLIFSNFFFVLIDFLKNISKKSIPFWFKRRIRAITSSIIDIIIFISIYALYDLSFNYILLTILGTWSITSYIMGRYNFGKYNNKDKLKFKREIIKNLVFTIVITLSPAKKILVSKF